MNDHKRTPSKETHYAGDASVLRICRIEIERGRKCARVLVSGADRILFCTDEGVVLEARGEEIRIMGREIVCLTYEGGIAEVSGEVSGISFSEEGQG